jgi:transcription termination factor Rho
MTKAELEKKPLSDLHALAAESGVERYRMLSRSELIERLSGGEAEPGSRASAPRPQRRERPQRQRRERPPRERPQRERPPRDRAPEQAPPERAQEQAPPERAPEPTPAPPEAPRSAAEEARPRRRRRRRRFGRRKEGVTLQDLLLPPEAGRQAVICAETAEACTALLRAVAADLAGDSKGPDPVALLIDPSPEELADWKREAPQAEIVAAGQARHASDALAQAAARAGSGEDVILLVDSLTRLAEAYGEADAAKEFFDAGRVQAGAGGGSLTVVAALERPSSS